VKHRLEHCPVVLDLQQTPPNESGPLYGRVPRLESIPYCHWDAPPESFRPLDFGAGADGRVLPFTNAGVKRPAVRRLGEHCASDTAR
jgi:hypothetical protein